MPSKYYSEINVGYSIEQFSNECGLWNDYVPMHDFVTWASVKSVARRILTPHQFRVFVLSGRGLNQPEIGIVLGVSSQTIGKVLSRSIKNLNKFFYKWFHSGVIIEGRGFREYVNREKLLKKGLYGERKYHRRRYL
jgi:hypothetical protein